MGFNPWHRARPADFVAHWTYGAGHGYLYLWKFGGVQRFYLS